MHLFEISPSLANRLLGLYVEKGIVQKADIGEKVASALRKSIARSFLTTLARFIQDLRHDKPFDLKLMMGGKFHRLFRPRAASPYMLHDARGEVLLKVFEREFLAWAQGYGIMYRFGLELPVGSFTVSDDNVSIYIFARTTAHAPGYAFDTTPL